MADVKWIKFYIDMFDKRKIKKIRRLPDGDRILLFWVMLLATAGKCNAGGMIFITENVPFEEEDLADEFDFEPSTIKSALDIFVRLDMISVSEEGYILVNGWEEHQSADKLAEIRAKDRERKRLKKAQVSGELPSSTEIPRKFHGNSTDVPHIEEEGEEDQEKESHSFTPAREESKMRLLGGYLGKGVVILSDEQIESLLDQMSVEEFDKYVGIIADMELSGKHYKKKTHYQAILDMVSKDRRVSQA